MYLLQHKAIRNVDIELIKNYYMENKNLAVQIKKGSKKFLGTFAVDNVDFEALYGEVHAVIGENRAGNLL